MSTATVNTGVNITEQPVTYENGSYSRLFIGEGDGASFSIVPEDQAKTKLEEYEKEVAEGKNPPKVVVETQTFSFPSAGNVAGMEQLVPDEKERVQLFNRGLQVKLQNKARSILKASEDGELTHVVTEGALDMTEYANVPTSRRGLSTFDKTLALLHELSPDQRAALLAMLQPE